MSDTTMFRTTTAEINLGHLAHNAALLRGLLAPGAFFCPMVKADAYGHGDIEVTRALRDAGVEHVGVAFIEEGARLRAAGIGGSILVFGDFDRAGAREMVRLDLTPVLSRWPQLEAFAEAAGPGARVHLKFNTGMNRLGFAVEEAPRLRRFLDARPGLALEGVCTHLFRGENAGVPGGESERQLIQLQTAAEAFKGLPFRLHALNSAGLATVTHRLRAGADLGRGSVWPVGARPGISLYGVQPSSDERVSLDLRPVMTVRSSVVTVHRLRAGEKVSYSGTWTATRPSVIGVLPIGYADGYPRALSNKGEVLCRGRRVPVVGTVCMDYMMIDLTDLENATGEVRAGEEAVLFGEQGAARLPVEELAERIGTIGSELLPRVSGRVPRRYKR